MKPFLFLLPLLLGSSCLTPGLDARIAAQAKSRTLWTAQDDLSIEEDTTHNRELIAAEGEGVTLTMDGNGHATGVTGGTHVLWQRSEPKDVMTAYMQLAIENAKVAARMMETLDRLLPVALAHIAPLPPGAAVPAATRPAVARPATDVEMALQILRDLQEQLRAAATQPGG